MPTLIGIALWALIPGFVAKRKGRSFWGYYFLSFVITPLITMIITFCLSDLTKQVNAEVVVDSHEVPGETYTVTPEIPEAPKAECCKYCGSELIPGSGFCSNCGAKVEKD